MSSSSTVGEIFTKFNRASWNPQKNLDVHSQPTAPSRRRRLSEQKPGICCVSVQLTGFSKGASSWEGCPSSLAHSWELQAPAAYSDTYTGLGLAKS